MWQLDGGESHMKAVAYIRRSHEDTDGHVSKDTQQAAVLALAERESSTIGETYIDWGKSGGDEALKHRPAFRRLLTAVERGEVATVYAYKLDRLGRGQTALGRLWAAAEANGTRIVTLEEGDLSDTGDPAKWLLRHTLSGFAEFYYREQKRKSAATLAYCQRRGDAFGQAPLGYVKRTPRDGSERVEMVLVDPGAIERVLAAYRGAGTFLGAARTLNEASVPVPRPAWGKGLGRWSARSIRRVVEREAPDLIPPTIRRGSRGASRPRYLAGLLRCYCGGPMTPGGSAKASRSLSYWCTRGQLVPGHGNPWSVAESKLLPWVKAEAAKYRYERFWDIDAEERTLDLGDKRRRLEAARDLIGEDAYAEALAAIESQESQPERVPAEAPPLDWAWSTEAINAWLRASFEYVELGPDLLPVRAEWTVPHRQQVGTELDVFEGGAEPCVDRLGAPFPVERRRLGGHSLGL